MGSFAGAVVGDRGGFERWTGGSGSVRFCSGRWATEVPDACGGALGDEPCALGGVIRSELGTASGGRTWQRRLVALMVRHRANDVTRLLRS